MTTKRDVLMNHKWASQLGLLAEARGLGEHAVVIEVDITDWPVFAANLAEWGTIALETISSLDGNKPLYTVVYVDMPGAEGWALAQRVGTEAHEKRLNGLCGDPSVSGGCARPKGHSPGGHSMYPILDDPGATPIPELLNRLDAGN